jgi:hypothetical protein
MVRYYHPRGNACNFFLGIFHLNTSTERMQQWKQENSFFRDPYDESCNFRSRPRKKLKTVTDWKELSQICSGTGQKIKFLLKNRAAVTKTVSKWPNYHYTV